MHDDVATPQPHGRPKDTPYLDARAEQEAPSTSPATPPAAGSQPAPVPGADAKVLIRPARPEDLHRVARLLALRGRDLEQTLSEAPHMIANLPVLLLARLQVLGTETDDEDAQTAPVGLAGAFILPSGQDHQRQWMVTSPVIDPQCPRKGVGRQLLGAVIDAVQAQDPGAQVHAAVPAGAHAAVALHRSLGFTEVERRDTFATLDFGDEQVVLLSRAATPQA